MISREVENNPPRFQEIPIGNHQDFKGELLVLGSIPGCPRKLGSMVRINGLFHFTYL